MAKANLAKHENSFAAKFGARLDNLIGIVFPGKQLERMRARAQLHQYAGASSGRDRTPPQSLRSPDSLLAQSDGHVMQRRSQDLGRNSAFIGHLANQYRIYALGDITWIPQTGDKTTDEAYRAYWVDWMKTADVQGRFHFIDMMQLSLAGTIYNGRHGLIHHHNEDGTFQLQSVMGYNIGNPRTVISNPNILGGTVLNKDGSVQAYDLYRLGINGMVNFVQRVPAVIFSCLNPVESTDEYVAKTPLHAVLNDAHDMRVVEAAWLNKLKWAAFKTAVFNTPNGSAPDPNGADGNELDRVGGESVIAGKILHQLPGEEMHGETGFNVEMVRNETPTDNETDFLLTKLAQIASALSLPLPFVWNMMGLGGAYSRLVSKQAGRAFQHGPLGQKWLERTALMEIQQKAFMSGIIRGEIPYSKKYNRGYFMYPAHPSMDDGNDSKAACEENRQGLRSQANINGQESLFWRDVDEQLASEAQNKISLAMERADEINAKQNLQGAEKLTWRDVIPYIQSYNANPPNPQITESTDTTPTS